MSLSEGHVNITSPSPICLHTMLLRRCSYYHPLPSTMHYTTLVLPVVYIVTATNMRRSCVLMCCPVLCELLNASDNGETMDSVHTLLVQLLASYLTNHLLKSREG
jgi:hypothetical protein